MYPAPGAHISTVGLTLFGDVHWVCAHCFELFIIDTYQEGAWENFRVHSFRRTAPCTLILGHCIGGIALRRHWVYIVVIGYGRTWMLSYDWDALDQEKNRCGK